MGKAKLSVDFEVTDVTVGTAGLTLCLAFMVSGLVPNHPCLLDGQLGLPLTVEGEGPCLLTHSWCMHLCQGWGQKWHLVYSGSSVLKTPYLPTVL